MTKQPASNMRIWDQVKATDPAHTKHVNQRGGFTSISAQYQVMRATEQFGPVGEGWGYDVSYDFKQPTPDEALIFAYVTIWHGSRDNKFGPVAGANSILSKGRIDDDAAKKAMTDALTKGLSHLGFSADVFLGLYDDNKYVEVQKAKVKANNEQSFQVRANEIIQDIKDTRTMETLTAVKISVKSEVDLMPAGVASMIKQAFAEQITNFEKAA